MRFPLVLLLLVELAAGAFAQPVATNAKASSFRTFDIFVDSGDAPLAAYQLECSATNGAVKIVGIEGGEPPAFHEPPFYDPKAMQHERVIIGAFSTESAKQLPQGRTRIATIHVQAQSKQTPDFTINVQAAADSEGKRIPVRATLEERKTK